MPPTRINFTHPANGNRWRRGSTTCKYLMISSHVMHVHFFALDQSVRITTTCRCREVNRKTSEYLKRNLEHERARDARWTTKYWPALRNTVDTFTLRCTRRKSPVRKEHGAEHNAQCLAGRKKESPPRSRRRGRHNQITVRGSWCCCSGIQHKSGKCISERNPT